jgi:uncharacterized repeat protein (TIGR02543 family)
LFVVKKTIENDTSTSITMDFPVIWFIPHKHLPNRLIPTVPSRYTVEFESNDGTSVNDQEVYGGFKVIEPEIFREGYEFIGWHTDEALIYPYDFDDPVNEDLTLYAKWTTSTATDHFWERVYSVDVNASTYPDVDEYTCPTDYTTYLPDANGYPLEYILEIRPIRLCNPDNEVCTINIEDGDYFQLCESKKYKVTN